LDVLIGWPGGDWQATAQLAATLVGGYLFILWTTSVLWVYRDIQQRTRDPVSQLTAVAISIVFPLISLPIYAALRPTETLQDSYLRLLEREVLLSELGAMQGSGEPRRATGRATSTAAQAAPAAAATQPVTSQAATSRGGAPVVGDSPPARTTTRPEPARSVQAVAAERVRAPVATETKPEAASKPAMDEPESEPDAGAADRAGRSDRATDLA
jgi:hypothetical protein